MNNISNIVKEKMGSALYKEEATFTVYDPMTFAPVQTLVNMTKYHFDLGPFADYYNNVFRLREQVANKVSLDIHAMKTSNRNIHHEFMEGVGDTVPMAVTHHEGCFERLRILRVFDASDTVLIRGILSPFNDMNVMIGAVRNHIRGDTPWNRMISFPDWRSARRPMPIITINA